MNSKFKIWVCALLLALLFGCGGGGGGTGGTGTTVVSSGVMTKGSVIVNGVRFEDTTANIVIDDTPKIAADLRDGMVVQVRGTLIDGGGGRAQRVEAQIEVRGTAEVTAIGVAARPQTFVVLGQTVVVDDFTVMSGTVAGNPLANPFDINLNGDLIEVHGLRDSSGRIRATRIEANPLQMGDSNVDEIRGIVSGLAGSTFNLGTQAVLIHAAAVTVPAGATFTNGSVVEVHCSSRPCINAGRFVATRIEVESAEDSAFEPARNQRFEVEGLVSGFNPLNPGNFFVAGVPVATFSSTRFEGGLASDLSNDVQIEAEGVWTGTVLSATKIEFKRSVVRLQGTTANRNVSAGTFDLQIADGTYVVSIEIDSLTSGSLPANGIACVQVRGQRKFPASLLTVTAGEVDPSCSSSQDHFIQAPVEAKVASSLTLLGLSPIDVSTASSYSGISGSLTLQSFLAAVTPANPGPPPVAGTLVKLRFDTPGTTVKEAEIED